MSRYAHTRQESRLRASEPTGASSSSREGHAPLKRRSMAAIIRQFRPR